MKVNFLRPGNNDESIELLKSMFQSTETVRCAVAYFNSQIFSELIIERAEKQLDTFLLVNTSDILRPQEVGDTEIAISKALMNVLKAGYRNDYIHTKSLGLREKGAYQNMHHKFIVTNSMVTFGSVNLTNAALERNFESLVSSTSPSLIHSFQSEFHELWDMASEIFTGRDGEIRSLMCPICERNEGVDFESYGPLCISCGYKFKLK